jgi:chromosome segregation ATPase
MSKPSTTKPSTTKPSTTKPSTTKPSMSKLNVSKLSTSKPSLSKRKVMSNGEQKDANHTAVEVAGPDSGASVDKIRDILFGSQIKNYEARFARLEENLVRETVELKETMRRRFESLEGFFKSESEALAARLKAEREERTSAFHALEQDLKATHDALGQKIHELDASTAESDSGLRKELMSESRKLLEEIGQRHDSLRSLLERRVGELRHQKTDRALLAALLAEIAAQIGDDGQPTEHADAK